MILLKYNRGPTHLQLSYRKVSGQHNDFLGFAIGYYKDVILWHEREVPRNGDSMLSTQFGIIFKGFKLDNSSGISYPEFSINKIFDRVIEIQL